MVQKCGSGSFMRFVGVRLGVETWVNKLALRLNLFITSAAVVTADAVVISIFHGTENKSMGSRTSNLSADITAFI